MTAGERADSDEEDDKDRGVILTTMSTATKTTKTMTTTARGQQRDNDNLIFGHNNQPVVGCIPGREEGDFDDDVDGNNNHRDMGWFYDHDNGNNDHKDDVNDDARKTLTSFLTQTTNLWIHSWKGGGDDFNNNDNCNNTAY